MAELWTFIQGFGALVGLVSGGFLIWDRFVKERPLVFIVRAPLAPGSATTVSKLRIVNRSPRPLLIWWQSGGNDQEFRIARDNSIEEILTARLPGEPTHIVDGNEKLDLNLLAPTQGLDDIGWDHTIETRIYWGYVQPMIWQPYRSIPVRITKKVYLALLGKDMEDE